MKSKTMKNIGALAVLAIGAAAVQGCTPDEVRAVGDIAIVAGAVAVAANTHCVGGYHQVCHTYRTFPGRVVSECQQEYDSCLSLVPNRQMMDEVDAPAAPASMAAQAQNLSAVDWAANFNISFDAAGKLIAALKEMQAGKADQAEALGLSEADLNSLAALQVPADEGVNSLAQNLDASPDAVQAMLKTIVANMAQVKA